jgi:sugar lactone lactonase YvrE
VVLLAWFLLATMADEIETISSGPVWFRNTPPNQLGESPIYRASDSTLHWIDCFSTPCTLHILPVSPTTGDARGPARIVPIPSTSISVIYFRKSVPGSYICGYKQGIAFLDEETGAVTVLKELFGKEMIGERSMNDGGVDPQGRFWIGEADIKALRAGMGGDPLEEGYGAPRGRLWRYSDGTCTAMDDGITCANGIGWSPDGRFSMQLPAIKDGWRDLLTWEVFFNDSGPQILWRWDFDQETGNISNKTKIIDGLATGVLNDGMVIE